MPEFDELSLYWLPLVDALMEIMLMALVGRTRGFGLGGRPVLLVLVPQVSGVKRERDEGCCRMQKTKVWLWRRREHCGCAT